MKNKLSRAQGSLLGQLAGDGLGSLVEFQTPEQILHSYPDGVRDMADGGTYNTIAGQPTDDSEMALMLARMLVKTSTYDPENALREYQHWLDSNPFDYGMTVFTGLNGNHIPESQANGAMMRISPLGIFGANFELGQVAEWAKQDSALTHIHPVCQQANALFAMGIAHTVASGVNAEELYGCIRQWAVEMRVEPALLDIIDQAADKKPSDYVRLKGWVLIAFQNALYQLLNATNLEEGVVDTIMQGGDTDTNAAICGALLGAVFGREAVPPRWLESLQNCRPVAGDPRVHHPRPECFWPADVLELAEELIGSD